MKTDKKYSDGEFTILLAEDDENDAMFVRRALHSADIRNPVTVVRDGEQALDYLYGRNEFSDRERYPLPKIAMFDLKMPRKTGLEVLEEVRQGADEGLKRLPIIMMSGSALQEDIDRAYELGVNAYLIKPHAFRELVHTLKTTTDFWRDTVAHPQIAS